MGQSRGINYEEYDRSLNKKLKVEQEREREYRNAKMILSEVNSASFK